MLAIVSNLIAFLVDRLGEVALGVQQAHRDEWQREITRGLAMISGEHAQAARVDLETLVKAVLGAKVRHESRTLTRLALMGRDLVEVGVETCEHLSVALQISSVRRGAIEHGLIHATQEHARIAADITPQLRIE